jgi:uncharacterized protein (UPF0216 family)
MNAYELADLIGLCGDGGYNQDAANMLRHQADYIKHLEDGLEASLALNKAQLERLAKLSKNVDELEEELLKTPQIKELSDEEIQDLIVNKVTDADMIRQALKKASEK